MENGHGHVTTSTLNMSKDINRNLSFDEMHNLIGSLKSNPETLLLFGHRNFSWYEKLTFGRTARHNEVDIEASLVVKPLTTALYILRTRSFHSSSDETKKQKTLVEY